MSGDDQRVPGGSGTDAVEHLMRPAGIIKDDSLDGNRPDSRGEAALQSVSSLTHPPCGGSAFRMRRARLFALEPKSKRTGINEPEGIEQRSGVFDSRAFAPKTRQSSLDGRMHGFPWIDCTDALVPM